MSLGAIHQDVQFHHAGCARLASQLRQTATALEAQAGSRPGLKTTAAHDFRGAYSEQFDQRVRTGVADAWELAAALRRAAGGPDEMSAAARREQARREQARTWASQQNDRSWLEKAGDNVHDFFMGDADVPNPGPPEPQYRYLSSTCVAQSR